VTSANLPAIRRQVGLLFQDPNDQLFCPTVGEDVAFGPQQLGLAPSEVEERVNAALEQVNLRHLAERPPHHLSGGEQRRACLAGVLACRPDVLLLDEPTSNLDPRGRREFKALIRAVSLARLIATHDLEMVAELCTRVIVLAHGRIVADGAMLEILADERLMLEHDLEVPHVLMHRHPHGTMGAGPPALRLPPVPPGGPR
jgi:energy-coupling factor transporter ATP-binding protein EcfA2